LSEKQTSTNSGWVRLPTFCAQKDGKPVRQLKGAGGSSGGSAAALQARFGAGSASDDTGRLGSTPAGFCGAYDSNPPTVRFRGSGSSPMPSSLETVGVISKKVDIYTACLLAFERIDDNDIHRPIPAAYCNR